MGPPTRKAGWKGSVGRERIESKNLRKRWEEGERERDEKEGWEEEERKEEGGGSV